MSVATRPALTTLKDLDLLVVATPTQRHGLPAVVRELPESPPQGTLRQVRALAFDTRYPRAKRITGSTAKEIGKLLRHLGCYMLAAVRAKIEAAESSVEQASPRVGRSESEIKDLAEEVGAGLITLGSRGLGVMSRVLLGSVSESVVRHAHCSVLVVRNEE